MPKINRKLSVLISLVLTALMFAAGVAAAFFIPSAVRFIADMPDGSGVRPPLSVQQLRMIGIDAYAVLALMLAGLGLLFALLILVRKGRVFTPTAVELIRYISWCLIFMGMLLAALTFFFRSAIFVGGAVLFVGLTVRVVKNVIEEAVYIKEENDLTV
ncbi:MAG: DUF2975 domain-containing protein [Clostridiales bacterium]|nr:DUF2975 domain-containing protein [Clostridiales bacterium]